MMEINKANEASGHNWIGIRHIRRNELRGADFVAKPNSLGRLIGAGAAGMQYNRQRNHTRGS